MSRRLATAFLGVPLWVLSLPAAILPERFGDLQRSAAQPFTPTEAVIYQEYGLDAAEKAYYAAGDRQVEITALRAKDATGAYAMYLLLRPPDGKPVALGEGGLESGSLTVYRLGNYVLLLRGPRPESDHLELLGAVLPRIERGAASPLAQHVPAAGRLPNSERYILGPASLEKLFPAVTPSVAAFHYGAEAQTAEYSVAGGRLTLALFSYPTPQLARAQLEEFHKLPGVMAKRSGPLIAAVSKPFSRDEAEKLLALVRYEATLTWNQQAGSRRNNLGDLILNIFLLIGIILGFAAVVGVGFGGLRVWSGKRRPGSRLGTAVDSEFIRLGLTEK